MNREQHHYTVGGKVDERPESEFEKIANAYASVE